MLDSAAESAPADADKVLRELLSLQTRKESKIASIHLFPTSRPHSLLSNAEKFASGPKLFSIPFGKVSGTRLPSSPPPTNSLALSLSLSLSMPSIVRLLYGLPLKLLSVNQSVFLAVLATTSTSFRSKVCARAHSPQLIHPLLSPCSIPLHGVQGIRSCVFLYLSNSLYLIL